MADQLTEGLIDPRRKRGPMPPPVGGGFVAMPPTEPPMSPPPAPLVRPAPGAVTQSTEALRQHLNAPPAEAKGARAVGGTVAAILGSLVNPQIGNILSQKLLHPGRQQWEDRKAQLEDMQAADVREAQRIQAQAAAEDLRQNRIDVNADRDAARVDAQRNAAISEEGRLRGQGAEDLPPDIASRMKRELLDPMNPRTRIMPGLSGEQQVSPDVGTVKQIAGGGYQNRLVLPTAGEKQRRKVAERKAEKAVDQEAAQADWVPVTEEIAKRFPSLGLKVGDKVPAERLDKLALHAPDKPEGDPIRVLMNPGQYKPEQVAAAEKVFAKQHRPPEGASGSFQALVNDTGEVTGFFNPTTNEFKPSPQAGARKTPLPPTEMVRRANLEGTIEDLARLEELGSKYKDKIGPVFGRLTDAELQTLGNKNPEIAEMFRISGNMTDQLLRERSGAAISEKEYDRLSKLVPNPRQPFSTFLSNLKSFQKERARTLGKSTGGKLGGAATPASQPTPQLPKGDGKPLDKATAQTFYEAAGGDPAKARQLAAQNGWK